MGRVAATGPSMRFWTYRHRFSVDGHRAEVTVHSGMKGLNSLLTVAGEVVARDHTPATGPEAVRNHRLATLLPDGRPLEVEAGYIDWFRIGSAARVDGETLWESHPGRRIAFPARLTGVAKTSQNPTEHWRKNWPSLAVDVGLGVLFFLVAKLTNLTTAALVASAAGLALVVIQRFVKVDLLGGLALFGIVTLLLSAGYALAFQDEEMVKMKSTILGLVVAGMFLTDGLARGRYLGRGLARYMPLDDLNQARLSIGVGLGGAVLAGLNYLVAEHLPTDVWLLYTTFGDTVVGMVLVLAAIQYARGAALKPRPAVAEERGPAA